MTQEKINLLKVEQELIDGLPGDPKNVGEWLRLLEPQDLESWLELIDQDAFNRTEEQNRKIVGTAILLYCIELEIKQIPKDFDLFETLATRFVNCFLIEYGRREEWWSLTDELTLYNFETAHNLEVHEKGRKCLTLMGSANAILNMSE